MSTQLATQSGNAAPMSLLVGMDLSTIDTDKLEKLMSLQERWEGKQAEKDLAQALATFQSNSPSITKNRKSNTGAYASLDDILFGIRGSLAENGLSVSFDTAGTGGELTVTCHVLHAGGAKFHRTVTVPVDSAMRANDTQKMGSAISYAKRYALVAALNLIVSDHDDDGATAGTKFITPSQIQEIEALLDKSSDLTVRDKMLEWIGVNSVPEIPANKFESVVKNLNRKLA